MFRLPPASAPSQSARRLACAGRSPFLRTTSAPPCNTTSSLQAASPPSAGSASSPGSRSPYVSSAGSDFGVQSTLSGVRRDLSLGKTCGLLRTSGGTTPPQPWLSELRGLLPARPPRQCLPSDSCSSARGFANPFRPLLVVGILGFTWIATTLSRGLSLPTSHMPCRARKKDLRARLHRTRRFETSLLLCFPRT